MREVIDGEFSYDGKRLFWFWYTGVRQRLSETARIGNNSVVWSYRLPAIYCAPTAQ